MSFVPRNSCVQTKTLSPLVFVVLYSCLNVKPLILVAKNSKFKLDVESGLKVNRMIFDVNSLIVTFSVSGS